MINLFKIILFSVILISLNSCSNVLQSVDLDLSSKDNSEQDEFKVVEKALTISEAQKQNKSYYKRLVLQPGRGVDARTIPEDQITKSNFPDIAPPSGYRIGIGDTLTFSKLVESNRTHTTSSRVWPKNLKSFNYTLGVGDNLVLTLLREEKTLGRIAPDDDESNQDLIMESQNEVVLQTKGRIGSDGSVLLLEVGRLDANGKTLNELQSEVRNILIRNGESPRFQLEISDFKSQKAYFTINATSQIIFLNDQKTTLRDILTSASVGFKPGVVTKVRLQREGKEYLMSLHSIFSQDAGEIIIYNKDHIFVEDGSTKITSSESKVSQDGNVVFAGVGKVKAAGLTLNALRAELSSLIEKIPGSENTFQIEVSEFSSQSALVNIPGKDGGIITITDIPIALDEVLTENGLSAEGSTIKRIRLQREGKNYVFTLAELINSSNPRVYIRPNDRITVETLSYKDDKVFILGGITPQIFKISPINRETLADVLFTTGGVLSSTSAKRSEVYLLRGKEPVVAYHLDAQNPTRLIVAESMELRPNDILFVAEQPIISFNRTLATIVPLRILLRDIQDENIP